MANTNMPSGLSPIGTISGQSWNQTGRLYCIANDASNSYAIGDAVKIATGSDANGVPYVTKLTTPASDIPLGIIVGIRTADPGNSLQGNDLKLSQNYLPVSSGVHYAYVVDDPNIIFMAQTDSTAITASNMSQNASMTITANQTTLSMTAPQSSTVLTGLATTSTLPIRIIGLSQVPNNSVGAYAEVLCVWNKHQYFGGNAGA
ncbi:MAG: hypothetical protein JHC33_02880 [Ignisphaera sp.]|jgi:hypothetical protein|nr:hypothetical protein [Ignisphaera sp.]